MNEPEKFLYVTSHKPDEYDISQHSSDEVANPLESPDSSLDATSRENEFDSIAGQVGILKGRSVTDEEWVVGLPVAGTICRISLAFHDYTNALITYMGEGVYCFKTESGKEYTGSILDTVFHKIKSPAQIAEEERKSEADKIMKLMYEAAEIKSSAYWNIATYLYDNGVRIAQVENKD